MYHVPPAHPKNFCRVCGQDFYRLDMFDAHRKDFKLTGSGTPTERLVGQCIAPESLYYTLVGGVWYDDDGLKAWTKLRIARAARGERA